MSSPFALLHTCLRVLHACARVLPAKAVAAPHVPEGPSNAPPHRVGRSVSAMCWSATAISWRVRASPPWESSVRPSPPGAPATCRWRRFAAPRRSPDRRGSGLARRRRCGVRHRRLGRDRAPAARAVGSGGRAVRGATGCPPPPAVPARRGGRDGGGELAYALATRTVTADIRGHTVGYALGLPRPWSSPVTCSPPSGPCCCPATAALSCSACWSPRGPRCAWRCGVRSTSPRGARSPPCARWSCWPG